MARHSRRRPRRRAGASSDGRCLPDRAAAWLDCRETVLVVARLERVGAPRAQPRSAGRDARAAIVQHHTSSRLQPPASCDEPPMPGSERDRVECPRGSMTRALGLVARGAASDPRISQTGGGAKQSVGGALPLTCQVRLGRRPLTRIDRWPKAKALGNEGRIVFPPEKFLFRAARFRPPPVLPPPAGRCENVACTPRSSSRASTGRH